jgi:hypothetical protein
MKMIKKVKNFSVLFLVASMAFIGLWLVAAARPWDGKVHAPLKTAQPYDWSAPDWFFTFYESGNIKYAYVSDSFKGVLELSGFKQAGPYVLTVDTADGATLADYGCDIWNSWAKLYGETFLGGTNGCWNDSPYADVKLFYLEQYDSNGDGVIDSYDFYGGKIEFDVPLLNGVYNLKFFIKLDWRVAGIYSNIMMMNDMTGDPRYGKVVAPKSFDYDSDLVITHNEELSWVLEAIKCYGAIYDAAEWLVLADHAWCVPTCQPPSADPGYQGTTGVVFYSTLADTFRGTVVLSNTVTPPTPQPLQIKLEGMGSLSTDADSNEMIGYIGRWWDNNTNSNIDDLTYELVKNTHNVLGYVVFDGFNTATTSKTFALNSSYHTLWNPVSNRPAPGNVVMADGDYVANFALTENTYWWRGVFLSEHPLNFTITH